MREEVRGLAKEVLHTFTGATQQALDIVRTRGPYCSISVAQLLATGMIMLIALTTNALSEQSKQFTLSAYLNLRRDMDGAPYPCPSRTFRSFSTFRETTHAIVALFPSIRMGARQASSEAATPATCKRRCHRPNPETCLTPVPRQAYLNPNYQGELSPTSQPPSHNPQRAMSAPPPSSSPQALFDALLGSPLPLLALLAPSSDGRHATFHAAASHPRIARRFPAGVHALDLGASASADSFCDHLLSLLHHHGLRRTLARAYPLIVQPSTRVEGVAAAARGLASRAMLLYLGDASGGTEVAALARGFAATVTKVADARMRIVVGAADPVDEGLVPREACISAERSAEEVETLLCYYAGVERAEGDARTLDIAAELGVVEERCGRSPGLAKMAGRSAWRLSQRAETSPVTMWGRYLRELRRAEARVGGPGAIVVVCGAVCEEMLGVDGLLATLAAVPAAATVPAVALGCLWGVATGAGARMGETLDRMGLLEKHDGGFRLGAQVPAAAGAAAQRRGAGFLRAAHARVVDGYHARLGAGAGRGETRAWWAAAAADAERADGGYLGRELARHLALAGRTRELFAVVCDYRWLETRVGRSVGGRSVRGYVGDVRRFLAAAPRFSKAGYRRGESVEEMREGMERVAAAAERAATVVAKRPAELAWQMFGRLERWRERDVVVKRFLGGVERRAERLRREEKGVLDV